MNFIISSTVLSNKLASIAKVMSSKAALPVLSTFLFELKGDKLLITASDGECFQSGMLEVAASNGEGNICITASYLLDALKKLPEQPVTFTINETSLEICIAYDKGKYNLMGSEAGLFTLPSPLDDDSITIEVPAQTMFSCLNQSLFAVAVDDLHPTLNGVFLKFSENRLECAATDSHRLMRLIYPLEGTNTDLNFILPTKAAGIVKGMVIKTTDKVAVSCNQREAIFRVNGDVFRCRLVEGRFPNYNGIIPRESKNIAVLDRQELIAAIRRVEAMCDKNSGLIEMKFSGMSLVLNGQDIDYSTSAQETILCQYNGDDLHIGFKADYLRSVLDNITAKDISLKMNQPNMPMVVTPYQSEESVDRLSLLCSMCLPN